MKVYELIEMLGRLDGDSDIYAVSNGYVYELKDSIRDGELIAAFGENEKIHTLRLSEQIGSISY